jgi:aspartate carbamoyltransferase catalytic subunit
LALRNLISIEDVSRQWWEEQYSACRDIIARPEEYSGACAGKVAASLFFEPSTRTNFSFQSAMMRLGGSVFGFSNPQATSVSKGETLADTIRMVASYSDTVIMRNPREGAALAASFYSHVPVINAGDGGHMHPTQTLTDLTTVAQYRGSVGDFKIGLCGDLLYGRTVHSLVQALCKFPGVSYTFISPPELTLPAPIIDAVRAAGRHFDEVRDLEAALPELDLLYMTRVQGERFPDRSVYERLRGVYVLSKKKLDAAKRDLLIMHPLPRVDEIAYDVDDDPRAVYFEQARYGVYARMALLLKFCYLPRSTPLRPGSNTDLVCSNPACVTLSDPYLPRLSAPGAPGSCAYCEKPF